MDERKQNANLFLSVSSFAAAVAGADSEKKAAARACIRLRAIVSRKRDPLSRFFVALSVSLPYPLRRTLGGGRSDVRVRSYKNTKEKKKTRGKNGTRGGGGGGG